MLKNSVRLPLRVCDSLYARLSGGAGVGLRNDDWQRLDVFLERHIIRVDRRPFRVKIGGEHTEYVGHRALEDRIRQRALVFRHDSVAVPFTHSERP